MSGEKRKALSRLTIPPMPFPRLSIALLIAAAGPLLGQAPPARRRILPELRADVTTGDVTTAQVTAGVHVTSGTYFRIAVLAGFGHAWNDDASGDSYRGEIQGRFHLDPLRSTRFGLYGIGGVATSHDRFRDWESRLVVGAGVELPAHARTTFAVETALAGGLRLSLAIRRVPLGRR
jgi:hypothetical protein